MDENELDIEKMLDELLEETSSLDSNNKSDNSLQEDDKTMASTAEDNHSSDSSNSITEENQKKIEVITGNGDLNISPVYNHLNVEKPKPKENKKIFIPEVKKNPKSED